MLRVQAQSAPPTGAQPFTYYLSLSLATGDPDIVNNHVPLDPAALQGGAIRLTKRADRVTATAGGLVTYTITLENTSSTSLPGMEIRDNAAVGLRVRRRQRAARRRRDRPHRARPAAAGVLRTST